MINETEIPDDVKELPPIAVDVWINAFNAAVSTGSTDEDAAKLAWQKVNSIYKKENDVWKLKTCGFGVNMKSFFVPRNNEGQFKTTIPCIVDGKRCKVITKKVGTEEEIFIEGVASNKTVDKQSDIVSQEFLEKMLLNVVGLNVFLEHNVHLLDTLGTVSDAFIKSDDLHVVIKLESPSDNDLVVTLLKKIESGLRIGLSIGGVVTKAVKETVDGKVVSKLLDGEIYEISVTAMPAVNSDMWLTPLVKSLSNVCENGVEFNEVNNFNDIEIDKDWSDVSVNDLPYDAFAFVGNIKDRKTWTAPHHFQNGKVSIQKVVELLKNSEGMPQEAVTHLTAHIDALGVEKVNDFIRTEKDLIAPVIKNMLYVKNFGVGEQRVTKAIAERKEIADLYNTLSDYYYTLSDMIYEIVFLNDEMPAKEKADKIGLIAKDFADRVEDITGQIEQLVLTIANELNNSN